MGAKATISSYDEIVTLDNFIENKEITLENFENIVVDYNVVPLIRPLNSVL